MFESGYENNLGETVKKIVFIYWTQNFNFWIQNCQYFLKIQKLDASIQKSNFHFSNFEKWKKCSNLMRFRIIAITSPCLWQIFNMVNIWTPNHKISYFLLNINFTKKMRLEICYQDQCLNFLYDPSLRGKHQFEILPFFWLGDG